jgi:CRISPR-associated protein Cas5d
LPSHDPTKVDRVTTDLSGKHLSIFQRRAKKGQCYHQPCFGCREFPAHFRLATDSFSESSVPVAQRNKNLGWMLFDLAWPEAKAMFFHAQMVDGVITAPPRTQQ